MDAPILMESSTTTTRRGERNRQQSATFMDSYTNSIDFPASIPWQTLSSDLSEKLKQGSLRINKSNCVEWATIREENERTPLMAGLVKRHHGSVSTPESESSDEQSNVSRESFTESRKTGTSWQMAAFFLVNASLGAGLLNYPVMYDRLGGIIMSTFIQLIVLLILASTMIILIYCSQLNKDCSYHDVLLSMCGKRAQQLSAFSIMLTCFGINTTFLIIIGDQYDRIFATFIGEQFCAIWYFNRSFTIAITTVLFVWPMCYAKRLDFLKHASALGIFAMIYIVFLNVYEFYAIEYDPKNLPDIKTRPENVFSVFAALPVVAFAYQTHEIIIPVYACMAERKIKLFCKATTLALFMLFIFYCTSGTFGYLTFGKKVASDIMQMYDANDPLIAAGILALVVKMITTFPPVLFCGRGAIDGLYAEFSGVSAENLIRKEFFRRIIITTVWNFVVLLLAVITPNITIALEFLGSLASFNVFLFPGLCMVALGYRKHQSNSHPSIYSKVLMGYGLIVVLLGLFIFGIVIIQVYLDFQKTSDGHKLCNLTPDNQTQYNQTQYNQTQYNLTQYNLTQHI